MFMFSHYWLGIRIIQYKRIQLFSKCAEEITAVYAQSSTDKGDTAGTTDNAISDATVNQTVNHEIVSFAEESRLSVTYPTETVYDDFLLTYPQETLTGVLERVYPIERITWTPGNTYGSILSRVSLPSGILSNIPFFADKSRNFAYFRANTRIGVRINGYKFQYGKLMIVWAPATALLDFISLEARDRIRAASGFPFVIVSPSENEVQEFMVPFAAPYMFKPQLSDNITDGQYDWASVTVYTLNPLQNVNGTAENVDITIYANFEDVAIGGPTPTPGPLTAINKLRDGRMAIDYANVVNVRPQARRGRASQSSASSGNNDASAGISAGTESQEEQQKTSTGKVSGVAAVVSRWAGYFTAIPFVGAFAKAVQIGSDAVGAIASMFGYGKPPLHMAQNPAMLTIMDMANGEGVDTSRRLALVNDNKVGPAEMHLGGYEGEMEISNIAQTPSLLGIFQIPSDTETYAVFWDVSPTFCAAVEGPLTFPGSTGSATLIEPTTLAYVSAPFDFWRGSIRYHFDFTTSMFHTGRVRISWIPPSTALPNLDPNITRSSLASTAQSYVIDLQKETEFDLTVPHFSHLPWFKNGALGAVSFLDDKAIFRDNEINGHIIVSIENAVRAPLLDQLVWVNVWVMAGPDFQLSVPRSLEPNGYREDAEGGMSLAQVPLTISTPPTNPFGTWVIPQVGLTREQIKKAVTTTLIPGAVGFSDEGMCMGEYPTNVKDLMCKPCASSSLRQVDSFTDRIILANHQLEYETGENDNPALRYYSQRRDSLTQNITTTREKFMTLTKWYRMLFRFSRGSMTHKIIVRNASADLSKFLTTGGRSLINRNSLTSALVYPPCPIIGVSAEFNFPGVTGVSNAMFDLNYSPNVEITLPYYTNALGFVNGARPARFIGTNTTASFCFLTPSDSTESFVYDADVYESAAEDFTLHFLCGAPALVCWNGTLAPPP